MVDEYVEIMEAYNEYRSTKEEERMDELLRHIKYLAVDFCELHDVSYCTRECYKHSHFQCKCNSDPIIASYWKSGPLCHEIEQVEKYIAYVQAHELDSLINEKFETSHDARVMKGHLDAILQICINEFSDNAYVIKYKERILAAMESNNILQEQDDKNISMEKEKEEDMAQPKLGDVLEPLGDDSNTQTQNTIAIYETPYTSCEEI
jgi:hypothetical protein